MTTDSHHVSGTVVPLGRPRAPRRTSGVRPSQRAVRTSDLLRRAAGSCEPTQRRDLIGDVVEANMGVADAIASRYRRRGVADEDLQQVAYLALVKAARRFDVDSGHDFLSFAVPTIRGELQRYFRDSGWMVRPSRRVQELQSRIVTAQAELTATLGRSPLVGEVATHLGAPRGDVEEALAAEGCFTPTSLDQTIGTSGSTIGDLLGCGDTGRKAAEARVVLAPVVRVLDERDRRVLRLRFYEDCTQAEIAEAIGVTQTQVSRILARIMRTLRDELDADGERAATLGHRLEAAAQRATEQERSADVAESGALR